ncbi:MAG: TIGR04348 family glycosyltransferase [Betaproteobacteria bacterium]|nr:TIGR04348 family glycosyltransferase [Betaproteobacteria bacterium]
MPDEPEKKIRVVIVTPALADANNGNWQTAKRWAGFLAPMMDVRLCKEWPDADLAADDAQADRVMIALHARRAATSIARWHEVHGERGLGVVLTGTDLYRDIGHDTSAQRSLVLAHTLVVLQERGPDALPDAARRKARVIFQSTPTRAPMAKPLLPLRVVTVGHLREEKSPQTLFAAARLLADHAQIRIDHIGVALDPALGEAARQAMRDAPNYRWLGGLSHDATRRRIQRAHLLVHPSRMEGGAHVIMEAVTSGTPVLASRVDGNVGMLGAHYDGYFEWNDAATVAARMVECAHELRSRSTDAAETTGPRDPHAGLLARLRSQCEQRAGLFAPAAERRAVRQLVADLAKGY